MRTTAFTTALVGVALTAAQGAAAQDTNYPQSAGQQASGGSSSHQWTPSGSGSSASASASGSAGAAVSTSSGSSANPLIPASQISPKCSSFLSSLNSDTALSSCTTPLLSALSSFMPSSSLTSWTQSTQDVSSALSSLCSDSTSSACSDSEIRTTLSAFSGNCTAELTARQEAVMGIYDSLYILQPLRSAVCSTDAAGGWCITDIVAGRMPAGSLGANATAVDSAVLNSATAAATAVATGAMNTPATNSTAPATSSSNSTTSYNSTSKLSSYAAASSSEPVDLKVPAPQALYIQMSSAVKRLLRRQQSSWAGESGSESGSSGWGGSSSHVASSGWGSASGASPSALMMDGNSTASAPEKPEDDSTAFHKYTMPSALPSSSVWSTSSLPFLLLSPNLTSSVLCSSCTKSILATYIAWEGRQPYALGLSNSPMLGGQAGLWTGIGEKCGSGFLEATSKQAGQENLTGAAVGGVRVGRGAMVMLLVVVGAMFT
ncbi:hypothetical protein JCM11641_007320 [Rhodosporidiobolus odoratus]